MRTDTQLLSNAAILLRTAAHYCPNHAIEAKSQPSRENSRGEVEAIGPEETLKINGLADTLRELAQEITDALNVCCVHPDRRAVASWNVPCAPRGKVWVCAECAPHTPENTKRVFDVYQVGHGKMISAFKQTNKDS